MRGFSLVEVLVSIIIFALLAGGIFGILNAGNTIFHNDAGLTELHQNARQAMEWMVNELRGASSIQITTLDSDSDRIVFNTRSVIGLQYYRDISDTNSDGLVNQAIRETPSGSRRIIANDISRLKFSYTKPYLAIEARTGKTVMQRPISFSLKEKILLRNE